MRRKPFQEVYRLCKDVKITCEEAGVAKMHRRIEKRVVLRSKSLTSSPKSISGSS